MSEKERLHTLAQMNSFEKMQRANGKKPSKTWLAMKKNIGSIVILDNSIMD